MYCNNLMNGEFNAQHPPENEDFLSDTVIALALEMRQDLPISQLAVTIHKTR